MTNNAFIVNVEAIVVRDGKFLMIVRAEAEDFGGGWLTFPGGKVDWNSRTEDALETTSTREDFEEVGLHVPGPWHHVENHTFLVHSMPALDVVLLATAPAGNPFVKASDEVAAVTWMTPEDILADPRTQPWTARSITRCREVLANLGW